MLNRGEKKNHHFLLIQQVIQDKALHKRSPYATTFNVYLVWDW